MRHHEIQIRVTAITDEPTASLLLHQTHQSKLFPERVRGSLPGFRARMKLNASLAITVNLQPAPRSGGEYGALSREREAGRLDVVQQRRQVQLGSKGHSL